MAKTNDLSISSTNLQNDYYVPGLFDKNISSTNNSLNNTALYSKSHYNTEIDKVGQEPYVITDLILSNQTVTFESNGTSTFIDIIGILETGEKVYLSDYAHCSSSDTKVAIADKGRIIALNKGEATITIIYNNFSKDISVVVLNQVDLLNLKNAINTMSLTSSERQQIDARADAMVYLKWTPTKNIRGWKNKKTFLANTTYTGIPYSQTAYQKNESGFLSAMNNADFYEAYTRVLNGTSIIMPKYGNDCSGFVSFAWNISRQTTSSFISGIKNKTYVQVGSYNISNPSYNELISSYHNLQRGDAVVKEGHTFLITANWPDSNKVMVYEQTPYSAIYTSWTYDDMASGGYMPFTMK